MVVITIKCYCILMFISFCSRLIFILTFFSGKAVIRAGENGTPFPLKRRDQLLDYILTLMGHDNEDGFSDTSVEFLQTQVFAFLNGSILVMLHYYRYCYLRGGVLGVVAKLDNF